MTRRTTTGCFWIFLTTELRSLTFCRPGVCKLGAPCGKRSTWRSRVGLIIFTITELLLRVTMCLFMQYFVFARVMEKLTFYLSKDCYRLSYRHHFFLYCSKIMKMPLETTGVNITVNMISQTACPDRHDVMCCLPPSYLGSAYVSGVWTVTK